MIMRIWNCNIEKESVKNMTNNCKTTPKGEKVGYEKAENYDD